MMIKPDKLQRLFTAARQEPAPAAPKDFSSDVLVTIRNEELVRPLRLAEQLGALFTRLALASAIFIVICVGADLLVSQSGTPDLSAEVEQLCDQWLFPVKGF